jgi:LytS/YehU family sensor histidine kinase
MAVTFLLVTILLGVVFEFAFTDDPVVMAFIGVVAFSVTLIGNGFYYLDIFHRRLRQAEQAALQSELAALRARIDPHFLFNSLNSIAALIRIDPQEAERVVESLSDLFRYSLRASDRPTVTLAEEIDSVGTYLEIERARFRDRLVVEIDVPRLYDGVRVPSLLLQPLVENAIKHGAGRKQGVCRISIRAVEDGDVLRLRVRDDGPGFRSVDPETIYVGGSGLKIVRDRLRYQFDGRGRLEFGDHHVDVVIPLGERKSL